MKCVKVNNMTLEKTKVVKRNVKPKEQKSKVKAPVVKPKMHKDKSSNIMKKLMLERVIVHICSGETGPKLEKAKSVLTMLTGMTPLETKAKVKLPKWGLRPGLPIGAKVTIRGKSAETFLKKALEAKDNTLPKKCVDLTGNFGFGIPEYIDIKGMKYDPKIGIFGFDVIVALKRKGFRIKFRHLKRKTLNSKLRIRPAETAEFLQKELGVNVV